MYSDGTVKRAALTVTDVYSDKWPDEPNYGFRSGQTGVADSYTQPTSVAVSEGFDNARTQLGGWMDHGAAVIAALAILGCGVFVVSPCCGVVRRLRAWTRLRVVRRLRRRAQAVFDDQGDDSGDDDGLGLNASDDLSDDDGEEMDDGNGGGGIGLGDSDQCVSCGASLAFGWDFDECPECGGV